MTISVIKSIDSVIYPRDEKSGKYGRTNRTCILPSHVCTFLSARCRFMRSR